MYSQNVRSTIIYDSLSWLKSSRSIHTWLAISIRAVGLLCCSSLLFVSAYSYATPTDISSGAVSKTSTSQLQLTPEFTPLPGVYYYDVFIRKMRVGKLTIKTEKNGETYSVEVKGRTRKAISALYKVRYRGEAKMTSTPVKPVSAFIEERSGTRNKEVDVQFPSENVLTVTEKKSKEGKEPREKKYTLESESFILDPFSTIFLVRALDWETGVAEVFDVFSGDKKYELRLLCLSESQINFDGKARDVWVIAPQATLPDSPDEAKLANFRILLSKDKERDILMISGDSKVGNIRAEMRKFDPLP